MNVARKILLNPGPATTTAAVKAAQVVPDICPRENEFGALVAGVRADLLAVAAADPARQTAVLLAGSGTAAMEAAIGSLVPATGRLLVLENGAYGERAGRIAARLGVPATVWRVPWTERPDAGAFAARLGAADGPFTHACWVHHETTTGLLNPLTEYGAACRARGVVSIVDAMSSFAGLELRWGDEPVDFCVSSANKCLQGMAGVAFVLGDRARIAAAAGQERSYALGLARHEAALAAGQFPFTPPVQTVYALAQALRELRAETVAGRAARYRACYETMLAGMTELGFEPLLPRALHSGLLTAFREPARAGFSFGGLHDFLYARGITIYPGKLPDTGTFRVANIGDLVPADLAQFVAAVKLYLDGR